MQCRNIKTYMETGRVIFLPIRAIRPNPQQPRKIFQEKSLEELTNSVRQHGILQPLSVRRTESFFELIAGERRLRAAQRAGLTEVPCIVMTMDRQQSALVAMVENLQRQDLDYIEEAKALDRLIRDWDLSQEEVARLLDRSQSSVANKLRLLKHSDRVLEALREHHLTERHGRALLKLPTEEKKLEVIGQIAAQDMTVDRTEAYIRQYLRADGGGQKPPDVGAFVGALTRHLTKMQAQGISAVSERRETEKEIVLTITFPKNIP